MPDTEPYIEPPNQPKRVVRAGPSLTPIVFVIALAVAGFGVWMWLDTSEPPVPAPIAAAPAPPAAAPPALPPLAERDARVRELVGALSSRPELMKWLGAEDLVRRFVTSVYNVSEGDSPASQVRGVLPSGVYAAKTVKKTLHPDPKGFAAYDVVADVLASIDTTAAARVYRALGPLFDGAFAEIAPRGAKFDDAFAKAIDHLMATPVPDDYVLVKTGPFFAFEDKKLDSLSRAQKQLLRMGPRNAKIVQTELAELAAALELRVAAR